MDAKIPDQDADTGPDQEEAVGSDVRRRLPDGGLRFVDAIGQGIFIPGGVEGPFANACLKRMLGCPADAPAASADPFDIERFPDQSRREQLLARLANGSGVVDESVRLRRNETSSVRLGP